MGRCPVTHLSLCHPRPLHQPATGCHYHGDSNEECSPVQGNGCAVCNKANVRTYVTSLFLVIKCLLSHIQRLYMRVTFFLRSCCVLGVGSVSDVTSSCLRSYYCDLGVGSVSDVTSSCLSSFYCDLGVGSVSDVTSSCLRSYYCDLGVGSVSDVTSSCLRSYYCDLGVGSVSDVTSSCLRSYYCDLGVGSVSDVTSSCLRSYYCDLGVGSVSDVTSSCLRSYYCELGVGSVSDVTSSCLRSYYCDLGVGSVSYGRAGVITANQIPLTTIVTHLQKAEFQTFGPLYLHALWYLPFTNSPRKHNVTFILATYRKFTVATVRFTQNVSCNIYTHPRYQQVANVTV